MVAHAEFACYEFRIQRTSVHNAPALPTKNAAVEDCNSPDQVVECAPVWPEYPPQTGGGIGGHTTTQFSPDAGTFVNIVQGMHNIHRTHIHRISTSGCPELPSDHPDAMPLPDEPSPKNLGDTCPAGGVAATDNDSNPINAATGNKYQREVDYAGAGPIPLTFVRHYNSFADFNGAPGQHWRHHYERRIDAVNGATVRVHRPDGRAFEFDLVGGAWRPDPDVTLRLVEIGLDWVLIDDTDTIERYTSDGRLVSLTSRGGVAKTLAYDGAGRLTSVEDGYGRALAFTYTTDDRIATVTDPDGGVFHYAYDGAGNLVSVEYPDGGIREYRYEDPDHPHALTAIVDGSGTLAGRWEYDDKGRAVVYEQAGGIGRVGFTYHDDGTTAVTDSLGGTRDYGFALSHGVFRTASIDGDPCITCGAQAQAFDFDANGFVIASVDRNGVETRFERDVRGLETARIEAFGTPEERPIETDWHADLRLPVEIREPGRTTAYTYDADGRRLTETVIDTATGETRTRAMRYRPDGLVESMTDTRGGVTAYEYNSTGNLVSVTNPLGQVTRFGDHDGHGNARRITDPNGVVTLLTYDARQRLVSRSIAGETTQFAYDGAGRLTRMTLPSGAFVDYGYDAAGQLVSIADAADNRIGYMLDATGNRIEERVSGPDGAVVREYFQVFDRLGRLVESRGGEGQVTSFGHDPVGNPTSTVDAFGNETAAHYDALNRVFVQVDALSGETRYQYDPLDRLTEVIDPRGVTTGYAYNAFGDVLEVASPDAGTTVYQYDAAGNRTRQVDARGIVTGYDYDALGRLVAIRYPDHPDKGIAYTWDAGPFGVGRLARISDETGTTEYQYDAHGRVTARVSTVRGTTLPLFQDFDADGNLARLMHPDGREVVYSRDVARRITEVTLIEPDGTEVPIATNVAWQPFGGISGFTYGNGLAHSRTYDRSGRVSAIASSTVQQLAYTWDATDNITAIDDGLDPARGQSFGYDALYRLTDASGSYGSKHYKYDAVGNRTRLTANDTVTEYAYATDSNRLLAADGVAFTYDTVGNTLTDGERVYAYDARNRMAEADGFRYGYNAQGMRVFKPRMGIPGDITGDGTITEQDLALLLRALKGEVPTTLAMDCNRDGVVDNKDTSCIAQRIGGQVQLEPAQVGWILFLYDEAGRLIGEYDETGEPIRQYVWLEDQPLAVVTREVFFIHADHLHTPRLVTDEDGAIAWQADYAPFGEVTETVNAIELNLRFPGQYHDRETGLHQNWHREYEPQLGRYTQSDPIGLVSDINTYLYAQGNMNLYSDQLGLDALPRSPNPTRPIPPSIKKPGICWLVNAYGSSRRQQQEAIHDAYDNRTRDIIEFCDRIYRGCWSIYNTVARLDCFNRCSAQCTEMQFDALRSYSEKLDVLDQVMPPSLIERLCNPFSRS